MRRVSTAFLSIVVLATACLSILPSGPALAVDPPISLVVNGRPVSCDVPPVIVGGRTLVPIRVVSENLGAIVQWNQAAQLVTITSPAGVISLTIGSTTATIDGRGVALDAPARVISGRTMVPIRFVSEAMGAEVNWDPAGRRVTVVQAGGPAGPSVTGLAWQETPGVARFVIVTDGPVTYKASTLDKNEQYPDRLLIDIDYASLAIAPTTTVGIAGVDRVRSFVQDIRGVPTARVVFDTFEPIRYTVWATWDDSPPLGRGDLPGNLAENQEAIVVEIEYKILGVKFVDEPGAERIVISLNGPADYHVWEADSPWRLVIDGRRATLSKALEALTNSQRTVPVGKMGVDKVRYAQFTVDPDVARIVVDAKNNAGSFPYHVQTEGNDIVISLRDVVTVTGFDYQATPDGGRITVTAGSPLSARVVSRFDPDGLILEVRGARLGGSIAGGGTVTYGDPLVDSITYSQTSGAQPSVTFAITPRVKLGARDPVSTAQGLTVDLVASPLAGKIIVLDPGHGGNDPGAIAPNGVHEADLTPKIAATLAELLRQAGADVRLTRTPSENPDKYQRVEFANACAADVCVAIHLNANNRSAVCGSETYYYNNHPDSRRLAEAILSRILEHLKRPDGGVRYADFVATREPHMAACLVEGLYLTNPTDLALLMQPGTLDTIARAIFEGLEDFFTAG